MQLHRDREKFDAAGARLVLIGQGTPRHANHFREQFDLDGFEILVDPDREAYEIAGAKVGGVAELFSPRSVLSGIKRAATERMVQGMTQGSATQLGGVLVVAQDGRVAWSHLAADASDNPPNDEVLKAVDRAQNPG